MWLQHCRQEGSRRDELGKISRVTLCGPQHGTNSAHDGKLLKVFPGDVAA